LAEFKLQHLPQIVEKREKIGRARLNQTIAEDGKAGSVDLSPAALSKTIDY
jgi:hypothetical protein|tara:strand:- start:331 stop:483 length:153 start_codon:yes stop_codon:yes gene_type:complete